MITEIAFTGTPVTDIKRAREFYEGVLGLKPAMESALHLRWTTWLVKRFNPPPRPQSRLSG